MFQKQRRFSVRKFGNKPTVIGNYRYDSKLESEYALLLESLQKGGVITDLKRQIRYDFVIDGHKLKHYSIVDFQFRKGDLVVWFEVKGFIAPEYPLKREIIETTLKDNERYVVGTGNFTVDDRLVREL